MLISYCGKQVKKVDGWESRKQVKKVDGWEYHKVSTCKRKNIKQILIGTLDGRNLARRFRRTQGENIKTHRKGKWRESGE
jgi:hypothetical protein